MPSSRGTATLIGFLLLSLAVGFAVAQDVSPDNSQSVTSKPASFASAPTGSAIVFTRPQPGTGADANVWIMDADGSNQTQLTTYTGEDRQPALSPDGSKIIYTSWREDRWTLWVMNSDGTGQTQLPVGGNSGWPDWSPDGLQIAFTNDMEDWWEIWVINANGTNLRRVTTHGPAAGVPAWSADGQKITYGVEPFAQQFDLYTVNSDGTGQTLFVPYAPGYSHHVVAWSPNGTEIATVRWVAGTYGPRDLYLMNAAGTSGTTLVQNIDYDAQNLSWSGDGNWIVFAKDGQVWRVKRDGTQLTQITTNGGWEPSTSAASFAFSPIGSAIVFSRPQPEIGADANVWIMNEDGSNQTQLTTYNDDDRVPALSPDGTKITFLSKQGGQGGQYALWTMNSDGSSQTQLPIPGNAGIPIWSPDGSQIAYQGDAGDWWEVWVVNADGSNPTRLTTHAEAAGSPSWSPDGQRLVYLSEPIARYHNLYIINSDGTGQTLLTSASSTGFSNHRPAWSPDGTQIATIRYAAGGFGPYDLWVMNADGTNGSVIVQDIDSPHLNRISWSLDSSWLVFAKNGQIWRVRRDGTLLTQISPASGWEPSTRATAFPSMPTGKAITFTRPQPETGADANVWIMDLDGSNQAQLTTYAGEDRQSAISPDGTRIAYTSWRDSRWTLWVMNSDGTGATQLPVASNTISPAWSPDGAQIAFSNDAVDWWEIWVIKPDGSNLRRLTSHGPAAGHPSWSPDGQQISYGVEPSGRYMDLYRVNADGTGQTLIISTASGYSHHMPAWTTDGTQIASVRWPPGSFGPYDLALMNADGTSESVLVTDIEYPAQHLTWSPSGDFVVFSKNGQVWRVNRDGTQLTQLTTNGGWEPSIGPGAAVCTPQASESDIILVVDRSGSMANENKMTDAKAAITTFLDTTNAPPDQIALISFSDTATLDQPLTTDEAAVDAAAQALTAGGNTQMDLGLLEARTELSSTRHITTHAKVIIMLSDGVQNPGPNDPVIDQANAAKAEGATIFTIGLGSNVDAVLLQQVATSPSHYYFAPTGAELADIYQQISSAIACPDLGGTVFVDQNDDGLYTPGTDSPVPNVNVRMSGQAARQTASQADGGYLFADNFAGTYTVTLDLTTIPSGYWPTAPITRVVSLTSTDVLDVDFGLYSLARPNAIVFVRPQPETGANNGDIWIMDASGLIQTQLTTYSQEDRSPALSPDGTRVAYVSWRDNRWAFWMMNSDGTNARQLSLGADSMTPVWSPDGSQIAFQNTSVDWWEIYVMNADGSNPQRITSHPEAVGMPSWSPDGQQIVYAANRSPSIWDLYKVNRDGTGQTLFISANAGFNHHRPAWSPDGAQIATLRGSAGSFLGPWDLWLMNADGSNGSVLVQNVDHPHWNHLSWTSDSNWLVFSKDGQVWRVRRDGTEAGQITLNGGWEPSTSASSFSGAPSIEYVYLPAVQRNYCSGPIVDDFSNPASGWYVGETSAWSYSYFNGEYRLYAKKASTAIVSRGERAHGQYIVEADARRASALDGTLGLAFGLTDDWSELFTFEAYPYAQGWIIWHYTDGMGWVDLAYGTSSAIQPGQTANRLRVQVSGDSGQSRFDFHVNGSFLTTLYNLYDVNGPRRVGLTATSASAGFDARFDNYKLVREGCPEGFNIAQSTTQTARPFFEVVRDMNGLP